VHRILIVVVAGLIGLAASVALYLGLVHAVPLVNSGSDLAEVLRAEGAHDVRIASVFAGLAGVLLLAARSWLAGGTAVVAAGLLAVLAYEDTIFSWGLLLVYVLALAGGCGAAVGRILRRRRTALSP
jgi:folate-dependent tRNA-U54 methylase TrmFO/GidA